MLKRNRWITRLLAIVLLISLSNIVVLAASGDTIVYRTKTGECYHTKSCSYLKKTSFTLTLQEAVNMGLRPCSRCHPPTLDSSSGSGSNPSVRSRDIDHDLLSGKESSINLEEIKKQIEIDYKICSGKGPANSTDNHRNDTAIISVTNKSNYNLEKVEYKLKLFKDGVLRETREGSFGPVLKSIPTICVYNKQSEPFEYDSFTYEIISVGLPKKDSLFYGNTAFSDLFKCKYEIKENKGTVQITNLKKKTLHMEFYVLEYDESDNVLWAFPGLTAAGMTKDAFKPGKTYGNQQFLLDIGCKRIAIAPCYISD